MIVTEPPYMLRMQRYLMISKTTPMTISSARKTTPVGTPPVNKIIILQENRFWKFKFNVNQNEKRKQNRNGWSILRGGRFAPPSQVPPLAFLVSFSFWFKLNLNFPYPPAPVPRREEKITKNKRSVAKMKVQVMTINSVQKSSKNRSYPRVFLATLKFGKNRKKMYRKKLF